MGPVSPGATTPESLNDLICLTQPDIIRGIHQEYLEAGADIIETNSFNATAVSMADYVRTWSMSSTALLMAREPAAPYADTDRPRFVAGVLEPTNKTASISPKVESPEYRDIA